MKKKFLRICTIILISVLLILFLVNKNHSIDKTGLSDIQSKEVKAQAIQLEYEQDLIVDESAGYENCEYEVNEDGKATLNQYIGTNNSIVIDDEIDGYIIDEVKADAFKNADDLEVIKISSKIANNIEKIENFEICENLSNDEYVVYTTNQNFTDDYINYLMLSDEEKFKMEVVPQKFRVSLDYVYSDEIQKIYGNIDNSSLASSYDLRDYIDIEIKSQGIYGICYSYATITSVETNLALTKGISGLNFSEVSEAIMSEQGRGGNLNTIYSKSFEKGLGPFEEGKCDEYLDRATVYKAVQNNTASEYVQQIDHWMKTPDSEVELTDTDKANLKNEIKEKVNSSPICNVGKYTSFATVDGSVKSNSNNAEKVEKNRKLIKKHIMTYGSLYAVIKISSATWIQDDDGTYILRNTVPSTDHAISLIGWDDTKNNGEGAYLALNSWGSKWAIGGMTGSTDGTFWISYEDYSVEAFCIGFTDITVDESLLIQMSDVEISFDKSWKYSWEDEYKPPIICQYNGETLTLDKDYTVDYYTEHKDDTVYSTITVTGIGKYTGSVKFESITAYTKAIVTQSAVSLDITNYEYDGTEKKPNVVVSVNGKILTENVDYTLEYINNINVGTATVIITGIGNWTGTVEKMFYISETGLNVNFETKGNSSYENEVSTKVTVTDSSVGLDTNKYPLYYAWTYASYVPNTSYFTDTSIYGEAKGKFESGDIISIPTNGTIKAVGEFYLWIWARNASGESVIVNSDKFYVDQEAPSVSVSSESTTWCKYTNVAITVNDAYSGINSSNTYKYYLSTSNTTQTGGSWITYTNGSNFTIGKDLTGIYYLWIKSIKDNAKNETGDIVVEKYKFDNTAPTVVFATNGNSSYEQSVSTVVNVIDDQSGIDTSKYKLYYTWTYSFYTPKEAYFINTKLYPLSKGEFNSGSIINAPTNMPTTKYKLWILAKDALGNSAIVSSNVFYIKKGELEVSEGSTIEGISLTDKSDLVYNTLEQELINVEDEEEQIIYYSIGTELLNDNYDKVGSRDIPKAKDAGIYKVYYYRQADSKYEECSGEIDVTIEQYDISNANIGEIETLKYTGDKIEPSVEITVEISENILALKKDEEYIIEYNNNTNAGTADIEIAGIGNFKGKTSTTFEIDKKENTLEVIGINNLKYNNMGQELVYACNKQGVVYYSTEHELTSSNYNVGSKEIPIENNAQTYTVYYYTPETTNYKEKSGSVEVTIKPCDINKTIIYDIENIEYTGKKITPELNINFKLDILDVLDINDALIPLVEKIDYELEYINNIDVGTATVIVTGKGNYEGTTSLTFEIIKTTLNIEFTKHREIEDNDMKYVLDLKAGTTIEEFKSNIETNGIIEIYNGTEIINDEKTKMCTGMKLKIYLNEEEEEYTIGVKGDINGDGEINSKDAYYILAYAVDKEEPETIYLYDIDNNNDLNSMDALLILKYIVGYIYEL